MRALRRCIFLLIVVLGVVTVQPLSAQAPTLPDQLGALARLATQGMGAAQQKNAALMRATYTDIHTAWASFEDQVRTRDATAYIEMEGALDAVKQAVQAQPVDPVAVQRAYDQVQDAATAMATRFADGASASSNTATTAPVDILDRLDAAAAAIKRQDVAGATAELNGAVRAWPSVESAVAAKSRDAYTAIEVDLSRASAALAAQPPDLEAADAAVARVRAQLTPFAVSQTYTAFDAAAIILREGLEALLVIVALLAFLRRSGNSDKRGWIWAGGALGVLASIATAFILQAVFSRASAGQNREVIEGVAGLLAAGMLFYVAYWLHSKASLHAWKHYIDLRTTKALASGSMVGLTALAFLAVFREGAETTVFYLGMAPSITLANLVFGLGIGSAALIVAAVLMLVAGVRLPLRLFFRIAGILVYYLGFKFVGTGIHALQVSGMIPSAPIAFVPTVPFLGIYPTWATLVPQMLLIVGALGVFYYLWMQDRRSRAVATTAMG